MLLLLDFARTNSKVNPFLDGSARWADRRDIKAAGLLKNNGVYVGAWRDKNGKIHYLRHAGPEHVLCYAPTLAARAAISPPKHGDSLSSLPVPEVKIDTPTPAS